MSRAKNLPENLLLDAVSDSGNFTTVFLFRLTENHLKILKDEAKKHKHEEVFLVFYSISEKELGKCAPKEITDYNGFDFCNVSKILFNGNTPQLPSNRPRNYISVTLVLKD